MGVLNNLEPSAYIPAIIAGLCLFVSGFLVHYLTTRRTLSEMTRNNYQKQLELVFVPIVNVVEEAVEPTYGYEGLNDLQLDKITKIIRENIQYVDANLKRIADALIEEQYICNRSETNYAVYDEDRRLLDYVLSRYNWLRKQLRLPYNSRYLFPNNLLSKVSRQLRPMKRRIVRKLTKFRTKRRES